MGDRAAPISVRGEHLLGRRRVLRCGTAASHEALANALQESDAAGLPQIAVSPLQGAFLEFIVRSVGARSVLEVGTLGGYSTIRLARGVGPRAMSRACSRAWTRASPKRSPGTRVPVLVSRARSGR